MALAETVGVLIDRGRKSYDIYNKEWKDVISGATYAATASACITNPILIAPVIVAHYVKPDGVFTDLNPTSGTVAVLILLLILAFQIPQFFLFLQMLVGILT